MTKQEEGKKKNRLEANNYKESLMRKMKILKGKSIR